MAGRNAGFHWHVHHDVLVEWCRDYQSRLEYIKSKKAKCRQKLRIRLLQPVKGKLPKGFVEAQKAYNKALEAYNESWETYNKVWKDYDCNKKRKTCIEREKTCVSAQKTCLKARKTYLLEIETLHKKECPDCPWNGRTIFPIRKKQNHDN